MHLRKIEYRTSDVNYKNSSEKYQDCITEIQPANPILILDEIQKISHQTLETIRLMTNFNFEDKNLFFSNNGGRMMNSSSS